VLVEVTACETQDTALEDSHAAAELAAEARTTAAALRRATGQTPRRRQLADWSARE
jgi:hypothetical protein